MKHHGERRNTSYECFLPFSQYLFKDNATQLFTLYLIQTVFDVFAAGNILNIEWTGEVAHSEHFPTLFSAVSELYYQLSRFYSFLSSNSFKADDPFPNVDAYGRLCSIPLLKSLWQKEQEAHEGLCSTGMVLWSTSVLCHLWVLLNQFWWPSIIQQICSRRH